MLTNSKQDIQEESSTSTTPKTEKTGIYDSFVFDSFEKTDLWDSTIGYTQREWDRVVGYGKVPEKYKRKK
tara:strand:- start:841 stop:1050 length:210 start_codon:yes stop_codon:yes gene_type:complete